MFPSHDLQGEDHLYYRLFYRLAEYLQPGVVVELGGWQGTAAAHFAAGRGGKTMVITIDHHTDPGDQLNKAKMLEAEFRYDNLYYIQGWTNGELAIRESGKHALGDAPNALLELGRFLVAGMISKARHKETGGIDILFIDSWHQYAEAMMDWEIYQPLLSSPALVICDDILPGDGPAIGGMERFWNELPGEKFLSEVPHPGHPMGFLRYEKTNV